MRKSVIIASLNWGLGHATRCIPIINKYISEGWNVILASDGDSSLLLKNEFPGLNHLELPTYDIQYARGSLMAFTLLRQLPKLKKIIEEEHNWLQDYLENHEIDLIISDNRFGFYSEKCHSIFITHQIFIQLPVGQKVIAKINHAYIKKFDEVWVPDYEGKDNLSGKLSHGNVPFEVKYIGPLSRLKRRELPIKHQVTAVLSGPEPSRSRLEKLLTTELKHIKNSVLIRGIQSSDNQRKEDEVMVIDHLPQEDLELLLNQSRVIICRSGYSSIMDLDKLNKEAILIPTPGQSEQEYLVKHLKKRAQFHFIKEDKIRISLKEIISEFDFGESVEV